MKYIIKTEKNYEFGVGRAYLGDNMIYGEKISVPDLVFEYDTVAAPDGLPFVLNWQRSGPKPPAITATTSPYSASTADIVGGELLGCREMFAQQPITRILKLPNTSKVTTFNRAFGNCKNLTYFDVSTIDTSSSTDFSYMFNNCASLTEFNCTNWNTSNVEIVSNMFKGCANLTKIDLSGWDTRKLKGTVLMFGGCTNLREINLSNWDLSSVTNKQINTFMGCESLTTVIMDNCSCETIQEFIDNILKNSRLPEGQVTIYSNTGCPGTVPTPGSDELVFEYDNSTSPNLEYTLNGVKYTATTSPYNTTLADLGISELTSCFKTFYETSLTNLTKFPSVKNVNSTKSMFDRCGNLTSFSFDIFDNLSKISNISFMFSLCVSLGQINTDKLCAASPVLEANGIGGAFLGCPITTINLSNINTSSVTSIDSLFYGCTKLSSINISGWKLENCTRFNDSFLNCVKLTSITMNDCSCATIQKIKDALAQSNIPQGQVTIVTNTVCEEYVLDIEYDTLANPNGITFPLDYTTTITATTSPYQKTAEELGLTEISYIARDYQTTPFTKINKFPTIAGGDCNEAFKGNSNIISLPAEWVLQDMTRASGFFRDCTKLTSFDASKWKVNFAIDRESNCGRFVQGCSKLTYVDISDWDIQNCEWLDWMFAECPNLTTIKLNNIKIKESLNTRERLDSMFKGDTALKEIYMNGCDCDTINKVKSALTQSGILDGQVTIVTNTVCP